LKAQGIEHSETDKEVLGLTSQEGMLEGYKIITQGSKKAAERTYGVLAAERNTAGPHGGHPTRKLAGSFSLSP
jgi:hypothetical protein